MTDPDLLKQLAASDRSDAVRLAAVEPIMDRAFLCDRAKTEENYSVFCAAVQKLTDAGQLLSVAMASQNPDRRRIIINQTRNGSLLRALAQRETDDLNLTLLLERIRLGREFILGLHPGTVRARHLVPWVEKGDWVCIREIVLYLISVKDLPEDAHSLSDIEKMYHAINRGYPRLTPDNQQWLRENCPTITINYEERYSPFESEWVYGRYGLIIPKDSGCRVPT